MGKTVSRTLHTSIPDMQTISASLEVAEAGTLTAVIVSVRLRHSYTGDLILTLLPPSGAPILLHNRSGGSANDIIKTHDATSIPALAALVDQSCAGRWRLTVQDAAAHDSGTLESFGLTLTLA